MPMASHDPHGLRTLLLAAAGLTLACSGGDSSVAPPTPPPTPPAVATVTLTPAASSITLGANAQLSAETRSVAGVVLTGRIVSWSSNDPTIATVSQSGLVTGVSVGGPITITATSEGVVGAASVTVTPKPVASVTVAAPTSQIVVGATTQMTATVLDAGGGVLTGRVVSWSSSNATVATVSQSGLVTGVSVGGPITITATSEGISGTASVSVTAVPVASVTVSSIAPAMVLGVTMPMTATTLDAAGRVLAGRVVTWLSSNTGIATVSPSGVVTGVATGGPVTITATSEGRSGTTAITIAPGVITGISNIAGFLERCPNADPAYATIRQDFEIRVDGQPAAEPTGCTDRFTTVPIALLTDELVARQVLRTAYYMSIGTEGKLPWTPRSLYDWMKSRIRGVNIKTAPGQLYCCDVIDGKLYFSLSRQDAAQREFKRRWIGIASSLAFYAHEIRHADPGSPGHVNGCAAFPLSTDPLGCDATYDLANLGGYGVPYWLAASWATGYLHIGMGCAPPPIVTEDLNYLLTMTDRNRFVANPPPAVTPATLYGGPCTPF